MTLKMISSYIFHIRLYNESGLQYLSVEKNCTISITWTLSTLAGLQAVSKS